MNKKEGKTKTILLRLASKRLKQTNHLTSSASVIKKHKKYGCNITEKNWLLTVKNITWINAFPHEKMSTTFFIFFNKCMFNDIIYSHHKC